MHGRPRLSALLLLLAACRAGDADPAAGGEHAADDTGGSGDEEPARVGPEYSHGACPALSEGTIDAFPTGDTSYRVKIELPPDPVGAPVLFAWHWLGGRAQDIIRYMDLDDLADEEGVIVIAPDSDGSAYEWHFLDDPEGNPDLLLFEDLLSCAWQQLGADLDRIHALGMSAGGLQTTYLSMHEAEWLASTAPFSGGTLDGFYSTPARPLPVLITWGGPDDTYGSLSFEQTSLNFAAHLVEDGSFVVECIHDGGHTIPDGATDYAWRFLSDHPYGVDPEPYADGLPEGFPSFCRVP